VNYREATVYFYTGTGNSYRVAVWMTDALADEGTVVTLRPIDSAQAAKEIGDGAPAFLGLVMPTHGFTTPWAMLRFAFGLPRRRGTHAVVVATRAGMRIGSLYTPGFEGTATLLVAVILAAKGYHVRGTAGIDMPSNWIALHPSLSYQAVIGIVNRARTRTAHFMSPVVLGRQRFANWIASLLGLLVLPISVAYLLIGRLFLAKLFFASDRCTGCGLCAENCPNGAIEMRGSGQSGRPYWTFRCESCMRCIGFCAVRAVEASHLLAVGTYLLTGTIPTAAALTWLTARVPLLAFLGLLPRWILDSANAVVVLALIYPLLHLLLRMRGVNCFFTHATLTHYYRRYHEPETSLKDLKQS
jgi:ferredoxin